MSTAKIIRCGAICIHIYIYIYIYKRNSEFKCKQLFCILKSLENKNARKFASLF